MDDQKTLKAIQNDHLVDHGGPNHPGPKWSPVQAKIPCRMRSHRNLSLHVDIKNAFTSAIWPMMTLQNVMCFLISIPMKIAVCFIFFQLSKTSREITFRNIYIYNDEHS